MESATSLARQLLDLHHRHGAAILALRDPSTAVEAEVVLAVIADEYRAVNAKLEEVAPPIPKRRPAWRKPLTAPALS